MLRLSVTLMSTVYLVSLTGNTCILYALINYFVCFYCRSVDEYVENPEFEVASLFISLGTFVGIFLGSFLLGCFMGLATALVSLNYILNTMYYIDA